MPTSIRGGCGTDISRIAAGGYGGRVTQPVLMGDPRIAAIPVEPVRDALVDFQETGDFQVSDLKAGQGVPFTLLRSSLLDRLLHSQSRLPNGYRLLLVEGHRPFALQDQYFSSYRSELVLADPSLSDEVSFQLASRCVSPPAIAPHVSGAAIDLTLCAEDGTELDLGTRVNATPEASNGGCYFDATNISTEARHHRTILSRALNDAELVNYPTEWWHWSFGDRYWAFTTNSPAALYGPITT